MATVQMTLAAAGLLVCGLAFPGGVSASDVGAPAAISDPVHSKSETPAVKAVKSKKPIKSVVAAKAERKTKASPASGRMQVEEPKASAPTSPARESKAWQKSHSRGLTEAQKQAFRDRKENMEGMIALIKEKRKALRDAKPEERAALARELHTLILEKEPSNSASTAATARVGTGEPEKSRVESSKSAPERKPSGQVSGSDDAKKAEAAEIRRKRIEAYQEQLRKQEVLRKQQLEKMKSGLEGGANPGGAIGHGYPED